MTGGGHGPKRKCRAVAATVCRDRNREGFSICPSQGTEAPRVWPVRSDETQRRYCRPWRERDGTRTTLAAATIWLLFADPVTVADADSEQDVTPVVRELAAIILEALRALLRYL